MNTKLLFMTIYTVQCKKYSISTGSEYGIVLLSTVRSRQLEEITVHGGEKKHADIGWKRANLGFITDRHQICVGITRCKYGLVIVGKWQNKEIHNKFHLLSPFHFTFPLQATRCFLAMTQLGIGLLSTMKETTVSETVTVFHTIPSYITTRHYYPCMHTAQNVVRTIFIFGIDIYVCFSICKSHAASPSHSCNVPACKMK